MTRLVSELAGAELDCWVARTQGYSIGELDGSPRSVCAGKNGECVGIISCQSAITLLRQGTYWPSRDWAQGGELIEREDIDLDINRARARDVVCRAVMTSKIIGRFGYERVSAFGPTPLIAAMRALVASVYGDTVPDEVAP